MFLRIPEAALCFLPSRLASWGSSLAEPPSEGPFSWGLRLPTGEALAPQHSIPHGREGQNLGASLTWASSSRIKASSTGPLGRDPTAMGGPLARKPADHTGQLDRQEPGSFSTGETLPAQSFGPGWDKGYTVSPGGAGSRGGRKVALLAAQGPIQPGPDCPGQAGQAPTAAAVPRAQ